MVTRYHSLMEKSILLFGNGLKEQKRIQKVFTGSQKPLSLVDHSTKFVVNYKPDVYFILRNNKKLIFEVLDSEKDKQDIIIADVIRSFLVENVEAIFFIYSGDKKDEKKIMEALVTISRGLISKGIDPKDIPFEKSGPVMIDKKNYRTPEAVMNFLAKEYSVRINKKKHVFLKK